MMTITRRTVLMGAAVAAIVPPAFAEVPDALASRSAEDVPLERQKIDLVAPPFVHPHEQATRQQPKIMEVTLVVQEKEVVEKKTEEPNQRLCPGIPEEGPQRFLRPLPHQNGAHGESPQEDDEDDDLGVGGVSHEESEIATPDGLVDEACHTGPDEGEIEEASHSLAPS